MVPDPPYLATCVKCGRDFRVLRNRAGIKVELSKAASKPAQKEEGKVGL